MSTQFDLETLSVLAAKVDKRLKWAGFLVAACAALVVVDLLLKRSIARQAVDASGTLAVARGLAAGAGRLRADLAAGHGPVPRGDGSGERGTGRADTRGAADPGRPDSDGLAGDASVAAGPDRAGSPAQAAPAGRPAGRGKRAPGHGPGTDGDAGGDSGL